MIHPGEYAWRKNDRYGSNHRVLTLETAGGAAAVARFRLVVTHSAGAMGKDFSVISGRVAASGPDRLELVAETSEHVVDDGEAWSKSSPVDQRMLFVAEKKWWRRVTFKLDGEPYAAVPPRR